jgi:hypothetical protein
MYIIINEYKRKQFNILKLTLEYKIYNYDGE